MGLCHGSNSSTIETWNSNENLDIYTIIWLDNQINKFPKTDCIEKQLRRIINYVKIFQDEDDCEKYINEISRDEYIILIINEQIGQEFISQIHDLQQIYSIYVYSSIENTDKTWINQYNKIKSICKKFDELIKIIETDFARCKYIKDKILFDIFHMDKLDDSNDEFIYSQILIDVVLQMDPKSHDMMTFISLCRNQYKGNRGSLNILREFQRNYTSDAAIWWLTRDTFINQILNKALKVQNIDLLFLLRPFIHDIDQNLKRYHCVQPLQVYRYQLMSNKELDLLRNSIGQYISINNFFLTKTDRNRALPSTKVPINIDDFQHVLFEITTDCNLDTQRPFANITSQNYIPHNFDEILFTLGSIFQLKTIHQDDNDIWIIEMVLSSQTNKHLKSTFEKYKNDDGSVNLLSLGYILQKMNKLQEAKKYYNLLLDELPDEDERLISCLLSLGTIHFIKHEYNSSLEWLLKSLDISLRTLQSNDTLLGSIYYSMGHVYKAKNDLLSALDSYNNAVIIWKQSMDDYYFNIAECMNNIGIIYRQKENYSLALECFKKTLTILEKYLAHDDFDISKAHCNIASIHRQLGQYDLALEHYNLAFKILVKYYPVDHPNIAKALGNIGIVYALRGERSIALIYYEKAAEIYRNKLSPTHINNIKIKQLIRNVRTPHRKVSFGTIETR